MTNREEILKKIRKQSPAATPVPSLDGPWITYPDKPLQFDAVLSMIGGRCVRVRSEADILADLEAYPAYVSASNILSLVPGAGRGTLDLAKIEDPHELDSVDFAILPGEFGVAENAAVWVESRQLNHRVAYFICQHLALVIRTDSLCDNMHQAYERIQFGGERFGTFIAGPSKTADIEQSLVIGAHGPKSMTVYLVG